MSWHHKTDVILRLTRKKVCKKRRRGVPPLLAIRELGQEAFSPPPASPWRVNVRSRSDQKVTLAVFRRIAYIKKFSECFGRFSKSSGRKLRECYVLMTTSFMFGYSVTQNILFSNLWTNWLMINFTAPSNQLNSRSLSAYIWYPCSYLFFGVVGYDFDYDFGPRLCDEMDSTK